MISYHHNDVFETCKDLNSYYAFDSVHSKIHFLCAAINHLQAHCTHLEAVLRANNIAMPDNLPTPSPTPEG